MSDTVYLVTGSCEHRAFATLKLAEGYARHLAESSTIDGAKRVRLEDRGRRICTVRAACDVFHIDEEPVATEEFWLKEPSDE